MTIPTAGDGKIWVDLYRKSNLTLASFADLCDINESTASKYLYGDMPVPKRAVFVAKFALIRCGHTVQIDLVDWSKIQKRGEKKDK